ncbi:MAG: ornithine cyclodeaminase [Candidatus Omnitrophota bacterium]|jgi:ornithine cyclodeaminase/alanine dehydrogenase-like protein (mu-crystallin family)
MRIIDFATITSLHIAPKTCVQWVSDAFKMKHESFLPPKISIHPNKNIFINTMPCLIPSEKRFGVKVVSRYPERKPSLCGDLMLYDFINGELLAIMDATWITAMRAGAVAALAINTFRASNVTQYAFMGLGNTARATMLCLLDSNPDKEFDVKLLAYKGQEKLFMERFSEFSNVHFSIVNSVELLIRDSDVIISCVTAADNLFALDNCFKEGVLVVPVHTRGFQNCDLFFDKVFADDQGHIQGFKYFNRFKRLDEFSSVLLNNSEGRISDKERILSYNIGIALHDVLFASRIYNMLDITDSNIKLMSIKEKFWI